MSDFVLSCCSTADLSKEFLDGRNISYACFHYFLDEVEYVDDMGQSMPLDKFYQAMKDGASTRTSQINISEYLDYFTKFLEEGRDVLHVTLSSGISGSYISAESAAVIARERYPERKIYVVDSLAASSGFGLLVDKLADLRDEGKSIDEIYNWAEENKLNVHHWFFSSDLTFFVKGGRISKASGVFGGMLNICPLMNVDYMGRLIPREKIRTKKRVIKAAYEKMVEHAVDGADYSGKCFISHSGFCHEDAVELANLIKEGFPNLNGEPMICDIGTVIGSHTGPGTVALFFWGDKRED